MGTIEALESTDIVLLLLGTPPEIFEGQFWLSSSGDLACHRDANRALPNLARMKVYEVVGVHVLQAALCAPALAAECNNESAIAPEHPIGAIRPTVIPEGEQGAAVPDELQSLRAASERHDANKKIIHAALDAAGAPQFESEECRMSHRLKWVIADNERLRGAIGKSMTLIWPESVYALEAALSAPAAPASEKTGGELQSPSVALKKTGENSNAEGERLWPPPQDKETDHEG